MAKQRLWWQFGRFAEVVKDLDPPAEGFQPAMLPHSCLRVYVLKGRHTVLLWCRDTQNPWRSEVAEGKAPDVVDDAFLDLAALKVGNAPTQIYDPWQNRSTKAELDGGRLRLPAFKRSLVVRLTLQLGSGPEREH